MVSAKRGACRRCALIVIPGWVRGGWAKRVSSGSSGLDAGSVGGGQACDAVPTGPTRTERRRKRGFAAVLRPAATLGRVIHGEGDDVRGAMRCLELMGCRGPRPLRHRSGGDSGGDWPVGPPVDTPDSLVAVDAAHRAMRRQGVCRYLRGTSNSACESLLFRYGPLRLLFCRLDFSFSLPSPTSLPHRLPLLARRHLRRALPALHRLRRRRTPSQRLEIRLGRELVVLWDAPPVRRGPPRDFRHPRPSRTTPATIIAGAVTHSIPPPLGPPDERRSSHRPGERQHSRMVARPSQPPRCPESCP